MSNLIPINDIEKMAKAITASKLFGVKDVDQAVALPAPPARQPVGCCPRYGLEGHALLLLGGDHIAPVEIVTEMANEAQGC